MSPKIVRLILGRGDAVVGKERYFNNSMFAKNINSGCCEGADAAR